MKKNPIVFFAAVLLLFCSCQKEEEELIDGKQIIELACPAEVEDWYFNKYQERSSDELINLFNGQSEKYIIVKREYESCDKLLIDVMAGKEPDLLYVGDWLDMSALYSKGLLCDLYTLIDNDEDVSMDTYIEPVLKAFEVGGRLYQMPHDFAVQSAVVKDDIWGDDTDTSYEHIIEKAEELGFEVPFDLSINSYGFTSFASSEFIDFENGTCSFDDGRFEKFIFVMKKYYDEYGSILENYPNGAYDLFKENKVMMMYSEFANTNQIEYLSAEFVAGEELRYIGFPSETSNYHIATPCVSFAIFESSEKKQAAFEFMKFYTDYGTYIYDTPRADGVTQKGSLLPINKAVLDYYSEQSLNEDFNFYGFDDDTRKKYQDEMLEQIYTINAANNYAGSTVKDILTEEITTYINGEKSVSEVCSIIQNRVSTYLEENYG